MAVANNKMTYDAIVREIEAKNFRPVYFLMGDESYYIDRLTDLVITNALTEDERDFNLFNLYGLDTDISKIVNTAKGFPLGVEHLVVVVREAQNVRNLDRLEFYLQQPQASTILVICYKNGSVDKRKRVALLADKVGVLFESKKIRDSQLPAFINDYLKHKRIAIEPKAASMLTEFVGADLNRMSGELDKLVISLSNGEKLIKAETVEKNIGISKDFNYFELQNALVAKDIYKANLIVNYFENNPKANPIQATLSMLFRFFANLMLAYYSPDKSDRGISAWIGLQEWQVRANIVPAMKRYSGVKVMRIIGQIRETDAKSKGLGGGNIPTGELLRELIFFILH